MWPFTPNLKSKDYRVRECAVKRLKPGNPKYLKILTDLAKNDKSETVRIAAISKLSDPEFLFNLATRDKTYEIRKAAVLALKEDNLLSRIAEDDNASYLLRELAVRSISEINILEKWALKANDLSQNAVQLISDQKILGKIASKGKNWKARYIAIGKLEDLSLKAVNLIDLFEKGNELNKQKIAPQLKEFYQNAQLSLASKERILNLKGTILKSHADREKYYDLSPECNLNFRYSHIDEKTQLFSI